MIENQNRLRNFNEVMSPRVVLDRIEDEPASVWLDSDPFSSSEVKIEHEVMIKVEPMDFELDDAVKWESLVPQTKLEEQTDIKVEAMIADINPSKRVRKQVVKQFVPIENKTKRIWKKRVGPKIPTRSRQCPLCPKMLKLSYYNQHVRFSSHAVNEKQPYKQIFFHRSEFTGWEN
jgi:hypothetical protein